MTLRNLHIFRYILTIHFPKLLTLIKKSGRQNFIDSYSMVISFGRNPGRSKKKLFYGHVRSNDRR